MLIFLSILNIIGLIILWLYTIATLQEVVKIKADVSVITELTVKKSAKEISDEILQRGGKLDTDTLKIVLEGEDENV